MDASSWKEGVGELCCLGRQELLACEDRAGGSPGGLPTLSQLPANLLALPRAVPVLAAQASEAVVVPWLAGGMLVSPPNRQQSPTMVTSPLCVYTLPLQVWQYNKWEGLTPTAHGKSPHIGVGLVFQCHSRMWMEPAPCSLLLLCNGSSTSCHSKSRGEQQFQAHCAELMLRQSLLITHSFFLSLGPPGQTCASCPLAPLGSCSLNWHCAETH